MGSRFILPAATELQPLVQGTLSRLCGLYSALNGIQLALYPQRLRKSELQAIYLHGIAHLSRRRQLNKVVGVGMSEDVWLTLTKALLVHVNDAYLTSLTLVPTLSPSAAKDRVRALDRIRADLGRRRPVLICFGGTLDHFTTVCGFSGDRLFLFDSSGLRWVEARNVGVGPASTRLHWISASSTVTIVDDW